MAKDNRDNRTSVEHAPIPTPEDGPGYEMEQRVAEHGQRMAKGVGFQGFTSGVEHPGGTPPTTADVTSEPVEADGPAEDAGGDSPEE